MVSVKRFLLAALVILVLHETSLAQSLVDRELRHWIRKQVTTEDDLERYGLLADKDWAQTNSKLDLVVLIHGLNSTSKDSEALICEARQANYPCATFEYPNDQPVAGSAKLLSRELKYFAEEYPNRRLVLVTHSMGGLVARATIENPELNPGNVRRLIMVAPPNFGSLFAHFGIGTDLVEHLFRGDDAKPLIRLRRSVVDGLGEAIDDLRTDSPFLKKLNARGRNKNVRYTILLGTAGAINEVQLAAIRQGLAWYLENASFLIKQVKYVDSILADMDEVLQGRGDSVVAVKRGRLAGVEDTVLLKFHHMRVVAPADGDPVVAQVQQIIFDRIRRRE